MSTFVVHDSYRGESGALKSVGCCPERMRSPRASPLPLRSLPPSAPRCRRRRSPQTIARKPEKEEAKKRLLGSIHIRSAGQTKDEVMQSASVVGRLEVDKRHDTRCTHGNESR